MVRSAKSEYSVDETDATKCTMGNDMFSDGILDVIPSNQIAKNMIKMYQAIVFH